MESDEKVLYRLIIGDEDASYHFRDIRYHENDMLLARMKQMFTKTFSQIS